MSKSLSFVKDRILTHSTYTDRDLDKAVEIEWTEKLFDQITESTLNGLRKYGISYDSEDEGHVELNISISFDPDDDFDYFTSEVVTHDGTLLFIYEAVELCLKRVLAGITYCADSVSEEDPFPQIGESIEYVLGNAICISEIDPKFAPPGKPWMQERSTVMLPIKFTRHKERTDIV